MYGIDTGDQALMASRSWIWLRGRILGLMSRPPGFTPDGRAIASTRIGLQLNPPPPPEHQER